MNKDERTVNQFLDSLGYLGIIFEPDGNHPPDFLIDNRIAVEVRRLNQFYLNKGKHEPLENLEYSLDPKLLKLFRAFNSHEVPNSAFVLIHYKRPLKPTKALMQEIEHVLSEHVNCIALEKEYVVAENLYLRFFPHEKREEDVYLFGSKYDRDRGGWVVAEILKSLKYIVEEKTNKVRPYLSRYDEWWLVLVNHVNMDIQRIEGHQLKEGFNKAHCFDKIMIISQHDSANGYLTL